MSHRLRRALVLVLLALGLPGVLPGAAARSATARVIEHPAHSQHLDGRHPAVLVPVLIIEPVLVPVLVIEPIAVRIWLSDPISVAALPPRYAAGRRAAPGQGSGQVPGSTEASTL